MSSPGQESNPQLSDTDRAIQNRLNIDTELAACSQLISDVNQQYQALLVRLMSSEVELRELHVDKARVLSEREMPQDLAGTDAPVLRIIYN